MFGVVRLNCICKLCHSRSSVSQVTAYELWKLKTRESYVRSKYLQNVRAIFTSSSLYKRRKSAEERKAPRIIEYPSKAQGDIVGVWKDITMKELAQVLNKDLNHVYELFMNKIRNPNFPISDMKLLQQALRRSGRRMIPIGKPSEKVEEDIDKNVYPRPPPLKSELKPRPPVVTIMGHVDHGKTTLLDALRASNIVEQEFGGITQHIGAFSVNIGQKDSITFLDTPGHAAFTAMRARGANLTDIVILVVAADDGVMEQTIESIKMAQHANVPIIVAINKIDSPKANIERTKQMLIEIGIQVETMGGDVQAVPISALKKQNLDQLIEAILLQAELLDIGGDPNGPTEAVVVESKTHQHKGKICSLIVQRGTLKKGAVLVADTAVAKVRSLRDAKGNLLDSVTPGYPVEIEGWRELPSAGDLVLEVESEKKAREVINYREMLKEKDKMEEEAVIIEQKQAEENKIYRMHLDMKRKLGRFKLKPKGPRQPEILEDTSGTPVLHLILKTDVDGTLEAIVNALSTYHSESCKLDVVSFGVGAVTQNDIELAELFNAIIYAFNVDVVSSAKSTLKNLNVTIKHHNVIYKLIDDLKEELNKKLPPVEVEETLGEATVLQEFEINVGRKKVPVAGCKCTNGILKRNAQYRVIRNGEVIYTGTLSSMRHLKDEVNEIKTEMECGLQLNDSSIRFLKNDTIVCFDVKKEKQTTDWDPGF